MLDSVVIENTTYCGANCTMCVREKINFELGSMSFELFKKAIDEIDSLYLKEFGSGLKNIEYGGMGDPLLDAGLEKKMGWIKERFPQVQQHICTTGHILDKKLDLVCKYVDVLKISNYGFSKGTYEAVHRGSLVYEDIKRNIDTFLSIPKGQRPKCIISFLLLPINAEEVEAWKVYYEDKCEELYVWKPHNWGGYTESETLREHSLAKSCGRPGKDFVIRANGDVSVCCWDFNREMSIGNISEESFSEIYYGNKLKEIKLMHKERRFFECKNVCSECDQLYDRRDALIYSSNKNYEVGIKTLSQKKIAD